MYELCMNLFLILIIKKKRKLRIKELNLGIYNVIKGKGIVRICSEGKNKRFCGDI